MKTNPQTLKRDGAADVSLSKEAIIVIMIAINVIDTFLFLSLVFSLSIHNGKNAGRRYLLLVFDCVGNNLLPNSLAK